MLDRISNEHAEALLGNSINSISSVGSSSGYNNKSDKDLFIDESSISDTAIKLYEREQDIKKFTKLALSDPDDTSADSLVISKTLNGEFSIDDDDALFALLSNEDFLNEIAS